MKQQNLSYINRRLAIVPFTVLVLSACSHGRFRLRVDPSYPQNTPRCIAIVPFENLSLTSFGGVAVGELLAQELERTREFVALEPGVYQYLTQNLNVAGAQSGDAAALKILKDQLGIDGVVVGSVSEYWYTDDPEVYRDKQPSVAFTARLYETENGLALWNASMSRTPGVGLGHISMLSTVASDVAVDLSEQLADALAIENEYRMNANPDETVCIFEQLLVAGKIPGQKNISRPVPKTTARSSTVLEQEPVTLSDGAKKLVDRLKRGEPFVLRGVTFEFQKQALRTESDAVLELVGEIVQAYPDLVIAIIAHTDNMGDPNELQTLSLNQAEIVRGRLISNFGAVAAQAVVHGRGGAEPLLPNTNRRNRQINRRLELQLVTAPGGGW